MRLDLSVKNKYNTLAIGCAVARNVKAERIVSELEKCMQPLTMQKDFVKQLLKRAKYLPN